MYVGVVIENHVALINACEDAVTVEPCLPYTLSLNKTGFTESFQQLVTGIEQILPDAAEVYGICLIMGGQVSYDREYFLTCTQEGWAEAPLEDLLRQTFHCPVVLGTPTDVWARQACWDQQGSFWFIDWGKTVDIRYATPTPLFVEVSTAAHMRIDPAMTLPCPCGNVGCVHTFLGEPNLTSLFPPLSEHGKGSAAAWMAMAIRNLMAVRPTRSVVIGGHMLEAYDLLPRLKIHIEHEVSAEPPDIVQANELAPTMYGPIGALSLLHIVL